MNCYFEVANLYFPAVARPAKLRASRGLATATDIPVRRYGGLKDQDRIFTNAYCRHDPGLKGAKVRAASIRADQVLTLPLVARRLASHEG